MQRRPYLTNSVLSRREALTLLGAGAAAAALPSGVFAQPAFAPGAVIRTILKDYAPAELAGGATLFHEHMSLRDGFLTDWNRFAADARTANAMPGAAAAGRGGAAGAGRGAAPAGGGAPGGAAAGAGRGAGAAGGAAGAAGRGPAPNIPTGNVLADEKFMTEEMSIAKREGIGCIVDAGHPDMGRDVGFLRRISQASGLPIVASAGFYTQPFYPKELSTWTEQKIYDEVMKQIRANPTGALGEIGSWDYITKDERKVFRAIGKVHLATNIPIFTHTGIPGKSALEQLDIFEDAGVDPKHIVIGHLGNLNASTETLEQQTEIHRQVIRRGAFIGFDRQGGAGDTPVVAMAVALINAGYSDNLMFASDLSSTREMKQAGGGGYSKTLTVFVPKIKAAGVSDEILHKIMYDNPRRFLAFVPKIARKDPK